MSTMFKRGLALALALVMCLGLVVTGNAVEASPRASYTYTKVTEAPADWSGQYLIVCENKSVALDGGQATLGAPIDVTISDGVITGDYSASIVEIKAMEGGYSIQAANGFYFSGTKAEGLVLSEEPVLNKITIDTTKTEIAGGVGTSLRYAGTKFDYVSGYMIYSAATITLYKANEDVTIGEAEAPEQPKLVLGENAINVPAGMAGITLTFTAPEEGIYVIRPAEGETNAWVNFYFESGITMPYEFSVGEGEEVEFNISANDMTADEINLIIEKKTAPKLELGINTFEIPAYGEVVAEFTAPEAGEYTIGAAEGTNNLTVYIEGDNGSEMVELPYTFTAAEGQVVKFILGADPWDAAATVKAEITKAGAEEPKPEVPTTATITFDTTDKRTEFSTVKQVWVENGITVTNDKASSTTNVADYENPARFYAGSTVTIEYPGMTKIEVECSGSKYVTALMNSVDGATADGNVVTIILPEAADSYVITLGAQVRVNSITVSTVPVEGGEETPEEPKPEDPAADSLLTIEEAIALGEGKEHNTYTENKYYVVGEIVEVYNTQYGNMKIKDENGNILTIYGTYSADGSVRYDSLEVKPVVGDTVKLYGIIGQYSGTAQMKNGWIVEHTPGEGSGEEEQPKDPEANSELTIPEAVELGESKAHDTFTENKYYITGIVAEIKSDVWGNMYIKDEAGNQIYIYGLYNEDGSVRYDEMEKKPAVGDTIKVYGVVGQYNGNAQIKNAWLVVEESAPTGDNSAIFFMMALMAVSMAAVVVLGKKAVR